MRERRKALRADRKAVKRPPAGLVGRGPGDRPGHAGRGPRGDGPARRPTPNGRRRVLPAAAPVRAITPPATTYGGPSLRSEALPVISRTFAPGPRRKPGPAHAVTRLPASLRISHSLRAMPSPAPSATRLSSRMAHAPPLTPIPVRPSRRTTFPANRTGDARCPRRGRRAPAAPLRSRTRRWRGRSDRRAGRSGAPPGDPRLARDAAAGIPVHHVAHEQGSRSVLGADAGPRRLAQLRVVVVEHLVAEDQGCREVVAADAPPEIPAHDVAVEDGLGPVFDVGPAEVARLDGGFP